MKYLSDYNLRNRPWWTESEEAEYLEAVTRAEEKFHADVDAKYPCTPAPVDGEAA